MGQLTSESSFIKHGWNNNNIYKISCLITYVLVYNPHRMLANIYRNN